MKRLVLIDGHALLFRAFYAFPALTTKAGELVNAVYGFTSNLLTVIRELQPDYIAVSFDLGEPTFRHVSFADYKAQRAETPADLISQEGRVREVVGTLNIPVYQLAGYEADDVIGTIAEQALQKSEGKSQKAEPIEVIIVTGDMDALQLVTDRVLQGTVRVYVPGRGKKPVVMYDEAKVAERYGGLRPSQLVDYKALAGDASDNIPGVRGVGPKTAIMLILTFGNLEKLYEVVDSWEENQELRIKEYGKILTERVLGKLREGREMAFQSKMLATIRCDVPIEFDLEKCRVSDYDKEKVLALFDALEFRSLAKKLPDDSFETDVQAALF